MCFVESLSKFTFKNETTSDSFFQYLSRSIQFSRVCFTVAGGGGTLGLFGWGCAAGTLEPLAYARASSREFCNPILDETPQIPPILLAQSSQNKTDLSFLYS